MIRDLFSRETRYALNATWFKKFVSFGTTIAWVLALFFTKHFVPGWAWFVILIADFIGFLFLGNYWANKDLANDLNKGEPQ